MILALSAALAQTAAPPLRTVGFVARPGGACEDAVAARQGECVDVVDFFPLDLAQGGDPGEPARAVLRDLARLQVDVYDGLAYRWGAGDLEQTVRARGYVALPDARSTWERSDVPRRTYATPPVAAFLGNGDWFEPSVAPDHARSRASFGHVRYAWPEGQEPPPPLTRLAGRFAERLGYDGRQHDFDLMDADPDTSGPFFEQLFPYTGLDGTVYGAGEGRPLVEFQVPEHEFDPDDPAAALHLYEDSFSDVLVAATPGAAREFAAVRFERFARVVYVQTTQFAMENFTTNQMRVLAATTAMAVPPGALAAEFGLSRDLVAAARGETDTTEEVLAHVDTGPRTPTSVGLRYESLPREVVVAWVDRLVREFEPGEAYYRVVQREVEGALRALLVAQPPALTSLSTDARRAWLRAAVLPSEDRDEVDTEVLRIALGLLVVPPASLPALQKRMAPERDRIEAWMLSDQARLAIASTFDEEAASTPREVTDAAIGQWTAVLSSHGYAPEQVPQGLGAVDPTAVCTRLDGVAALDEPSFGTVNLDVLVDAPRGLDGEAVLDAGAERMPFRMIDDPQFEPVVERLIDLGGDRSLYRVRWRLWSGWHLFWDVLPHDATRERLVLRTGAVCADTVLAPPDLVPTVVRAGLLSGNLRPTTPETRAEWRAWRDAQVEDEVSEVDPDAIAGRVASAPGEVAGQVGGAREALAAKPDAGALAGQRPSFKDSGFEIVEEPLGPAATYLTGIAQAPLRAAAADGLLVVVFDASAPGPRVALGDLTPRTPYAREQATVRRDGARVRTAAWAWWFDPERPRPVQVAPGWAPKDSVSGGEDRPRWRRRRSLDVWLATGASAVPRHVATYGCAGGAPPGFAGPCEGSVESLGAGVDLQGVSTWWFHDGPRLGLDAGFDARVGLRPAGTPFLYDERDPPQLAWAIRPQVGLVVGLRGAPRSGPLHGGDHARPWGAPGPDGRSRLHRTQWGVRTFLLLGPGFEGTEGNAGAEGWLGWSLRRARSRNATFTPYRPGALLGPYARFELGFPVGAPPEPRYLELQRTTTWSVGVRLQLRLAAPAPEPEALP
jgi:hypothetical protein